MSGLEGLLAGRTLAGRYRIEEVIGRGGFAVVYRGLDERLGRTVAVKVVTLSAPDEEVRSQLRVRFDREARSAARIQHPNVVTVHDFGTDTEIGLDFLVMEMLRGEDLSAYLARVGRPPLDEALRILREAAEGVAAGHRSGMIHRDVKPGNLLLARAEHDDGVRTVVLDFGIARVMADEDSTRLTRGPAPLSPAYASPEQMAGDGDLTAASDVFSLGAVGYLLLGGRRPFDPGRRGAADAPERPEPLDRFAPEVPASTALICIPVRSARRRPAAAGANHAPPHALAGHHAFS